MNTETLHGETAVFALTSGGTALAKKIAGQEEVHLYLPARLNTDGTENLPEETFFFSNFRQAVNSAFSSYRGLIFIMAAGIVVRTIAPLLTSKYSDPAVVVVDEVGSYAVSLISGHVGGANDLARAVAAVTGGTPVITTATDVRGRPAVDVLANQLDCISVQPDKVKKVNRSLAEGESVLINSRWPVPDYLSQDFETGDSGHAGWQVCIDWTAGPERQKTLYLLPRNLVVGIGCRRGVAGRLVMEALESVLGDIPDGKKRVKAVATVDVKKDEAAICNAAYKLGLPLIIVSRSEIKKLTAAYEESEFVKKILGVGGVCEPAAIIASNRGRVVIPKRKMGPVTVAVAEEKLWWWD